MANEHPSHCVAVIGGAVGDTKFGNRSVYAPVNTRPEQIEYRTGVKTLVGAVLGELGTELGRRQHREG